MATIRDVMTRDVQVLAPTATVQQAAWRMLELDVGALPVCNGEKLVGMITDRDIAIRSAARGQDPKGTRIDDVMSPQVVWCFDDASLDEVSQLMQERQVRRIPVVDRDRKLVGIVALGDLANRSTDSSLKGQTLEGVSLTSSP
ncbi:MAG: CBS domain-containing protein [Myxococcales bacterium]|nr:MAG: CBS domain-containing protein [Myxococcales bacterium]